MLILHSIFKDGICNNTSKNNTAAKARESKFMMLEKSDLVDIICNEEQMNSKGEPKEPMIIKLRSKSIATKRRLLFINIYLKTLWKEVTKPDLKKWIKIMWSYFLC